MIAGVALMLAGAQAHAANVSSVSATPNPFNANNAESTTISYTLGNSSLLWLKIYNGSAVLKRKLVDPTGFTGTNRTAGAKSEIWNGKDDANAILPDGNYPYQIDAAFYSADFSLGQNVHDVAVDPSSPNVMWYVGKTTPYVYKSTDSGSNWTGVSGTGCSAKCYGVVTNSTGQSIYVVEDGQASLNVSTDGGNNWGTSAAFPGSDTKVADVATSSDGTIIYVVAYTNNAIYKSVNSGGSWSTCTATGMSLGGAASGIGTSADGTTVIVTDSSNHRVYKSTNSCSSFSLISGITSGTTAGRVNYPYQVAIQSDGKFWVSERDNHRIQQFDSSGNVLMTVGGTAAASGNYQFNSGAFYFGVGLATISGQPYIVVADYGNTRIKKLGYDNWASSTHLQIASGGGATTTAAGSATASAASATSIGVSMPYTDDGNTNNTYTVDYKLSAAGSWTNWVTAAAHSTSPYTTTITGLTSGQSYDVRMTYNDVDGVTGTNPQTVTGIVMPSNATVAGTATATGATMSSISVSMPYTSDTNNNNTYTVDYKLSSAGSWTNWVTAAAHAASPYATTITGLTIGETYDVRTTYNDADSVTGTNPQTVSSITLPSGVFNVSSISISPNPFNPGNSETTTISYNLTNAALLWMKIYNNGSVLKRTLVTPGSYTATNKAAGANSSIWNGKNESNVIQPDGQYPLKIDDAFFVSHFATPGSNPQDVAVVSSNPSTIWMTDKTSPYVFKSTNSGSSWSGVSGTGASAKDYGIAVSADGQRIYISDDGQSSLNMSTNGGSSWATSGTFPGSATQISDVATSDNGLIVYALNYNAGVVYKSINGGTAWGTCSNPGYSLSGPRGITTNAAGTTVMIADSGNNKVWLGSGGATNSNTDCGFFFDYSIAAGTGAGQLSYPYQVEIQEDGKFWVSERDTHRIQQFDPSSQVLMTIGGSASGSGNYQFNSGASYFGIGLASISGQAHIFVADYNNARIKKVGYDNWSSGSPHITIASAPPNAPTSVSASDTASDNGGSVSLSWTVSSSAETTHQRIYRSTTSGSGYALLATINNNTTNSYADTTATTGTPYYYVIRAWNGSQESANSNQASATAADNIVPNAPTGLAATAGNGEVNLSWTVSNSADTSQQRIYRSTTDGSGYTLLTTINNNTAATYRDSTVVNGTTYYYVIRAYDDSQESANSAQASATPSASIVNAPTSLLAVPGDAQVSLSWTVSTSGTVSQQRLYRSTTNGSGYALLTTINNNTTNSYVDSSSVNATTYYYVIRAWNGTAESANSNQASATPSANAVPVAVNGVLYPLKNSTATGTLVATDGDSDPLTYSIATNGSLGTATITNAGTGTYQYVPNTNATGADSFTFRVNDGKVNSNTATISVTITPPVTGTTIVKGGWNMISIPTNLTQKSDFYTILLDDIGSPPFVFGWNSDRVPGSFAGAHVSAANAQPGKGYLVYFPSNSIAIDDQFNGEHVAQCDAVNFTGVQCVDVQLQIGGSMIGNPYPVNKDLLQAADVKICNASQTPGCTSAGDWKTYSQAVTNGWISNIIYNYNPVTQLYDTTKSVSDGTMVLTPWKGWWIRTQTADTVIMRFYK